MWWVYGGQRRFILTHGILTILRSAILENLCKSRQGCKGFLNKSVGSHIPDSGLVSSFKQRDHQSACASCLGWRPSQYPAPWSCHACHVLLLTLEVRRPWPCDMRNVLQRPAPCSSLGSFENTWLGFILLKQCLGRLEMGRLELKECQCQFQCHSLGSNKISLCPSFKSHSLSSVYRVSLRGQRLFVYAVYASLIYLQGVDSKIHWRIRF